MLGKITEYELNKLETPYLRDAGDNTLQTIVAPATNTKGIIVYRAFLSGGNDRRRIMAKATAPTSIVDAAANTILFFASLDGINTETDSGMTDVPVLIPPGLGLYEQRVHNTNPGLCAVEYKVLT